MTEKPPRRWFRFGLRTLLIVVTVLCCYLAWETSVVRQRQTLLKEMSSKGGFQITTAKDWAQQSAWGNSRRPAASIPPVRRLLGDEAVQEIVYRSDSEPSSAELARISKVFPEATFRREEPLYEPCHPGCFPAGALVETPSGLRLIESIQPGDHIITIDSEGRSGTTEVQSVFVTDNRLWKVETDEAFLITTQTQPLCLATDKILQVGDLHPGDTILRREDGVIHAVKVLEVSSTGRIEKVYNLILGNSEVFVADGFLARSKPPAALAER